MSRRARSAAGSHPPAKAGGTCSALRGSPQTARGRSRGDFFNRLQSGSAGRAARSTSLLREMIELLTNPEAWVAFLTLTALELVLGIDNVIFISILVDKLPQRQRELGRRMLVVSGCWI